MSSEVGVLQKMPLDALAERCKEETDRYSERKVHDTQYCFELFRRAVYQKDKSIWNTIVENYNKTVTGWVVRHYGFSSSGMDAQAFADQAFEKIIHTITADKFGRFSSLEAVLGYLKLCVHSVIVDFMRSADYSNLSAWEDMSEMEAAKDPSPEEKTIEQSERRTLWELLESRLNDRKERLVIECSFVFDLKPQQILDEFRAEFSDIDEIYRVKQNVISRLRRDAEFRKLLGIDD